MRSLIIASICFFLAGPLAGCAGTDQVMSGADRNLMTRSAQRSLEANKSGESLNWSAEQGGYRGTVTPLETYQTASGQPCRRYQQTLSMGGRTQVAEDTACRHADGRWHSINVRTLAGHASFAPRRRHAYREQYHGGDALFGLFYGLSLAGVYHAGRHGHLGYHWRPGHFRVRPGVSFGYGIRIGG